MSRPKPLQITLELEPIDGLEGLSSAERRRWFSIVGKEAVNILRRRLLKGLDKMGEPMLPRLRPRKDKADGPPLSPHRNSSRSVDLLSYQPFEDRVTIFWRKKWGQIMAYHKIGIKSRVGLRVRDVGGFTKKDIRKIKADAKRAWERRSPDPLPRDEEIDLGEDDDRFGSFFGGSKPKKKPGKPKGAIH